MPAQALLVLVPLLLACPGQRLDALKERELAEARAAFDAHLVAIHRRDVEGYLAGYLNAPDFVYIGPGGVTRGFRGFALARRAAPGFPDSLEAGDPELAWLAPGVVYLAYPYAAQQGDAAGHGWSERVFVKTADGWRIAVTGVIPTTP